MMNFIIFTVFLAFGMGALQAVKDQKGFVDKLFSLAASLAFLIAAGANLYHGVRELIK